MSLTTTSKAFKKGIKIVGIFAVFYYIAILLVIPQTKEFLLNLFVDRNPPNPKYGLLEPVQFVSKTLRNANPAYILSTKDGRLPAGLPRKMPVYRIKPPQYSYLAGKNAQDDATKLGFKESELISDLKGREYQWRSLISGGYLTINTETRAITIGTDLYAKGAEFKPNTINPESAKNIATQLLKNLSRYNENLYKPENYKINLGQIAGSTLVETKVISEAQLAMVNLYGKVGEYPIFSTDPQIGIIAMIVRNPTQENSPYNVPVFVGNFWDVEHNEDSSYPIISVQEAWKQVTAGKGVISGVRVKNENPFNVRENIVAERLLINKIYLAYYMSPQFQKYMQPIYVFEGNYVTAGSDGGTIFIYYPALTAEHTKNTPSPQQ